MSNKTTLAGLTLLTVLASVGVGLAAEERWVDPRLTVLPITKPGPYVLLDDGGLMAIELDNILISRDGGKTWNVSTKLYENAPRTNRNIGLLLKTRGGVIVTVFKELSTYKLKWDKKTNEPVGQGRLEVWSMRSLDEGKSWVDRQQVFDGYCGAMANMIQLSSGEVVVPIQRLLYNPGRHGQCVYVSADEGKTWKHSNIIDLGGGGSHGGAFEGTVAELSDGRLMMLLRTTWGRFWETYSEDKGLSWRTIRPSKIEACSAPGYLMRLASGRLVLLFNGRQKGRQELSIAFSEDDGRSWTKPVVIARQPGKGLAYPDVREHQPGELWIATRFGAKSFLCVSLREADFAKK